ncbi:MAG: GWxTD domain-containing protein, partial [Acidobacteriaceae bacterium]
MFRNRFSLLSTILIVFLAGVSCVKVHAQSQQQDPSQQDQAQQDSSQSSQDNSQDNQNPLTRKLSDKQRREQQKELRNELSDTYRKWLNQDVRWIITDQERKAFLSLSNDEERDAFIEQFWRRRNPNPDSPDNEFREEYYARIAYANEHFAAGKPGWKTDRGHMYIAYGKPDSIDSHPSGGT